MELQYLSDNQLEFNFLFIDFYVLFVEMDSTNYHIFIKYVRIMIYLLILYMMII